MKLRPVISLTFLIGCLIFHAFPGFATIPSGYYNSANGLSGASLKTALYNIIKGHTAVSYTYLWTAFYTTDDKVNGKVWDMYSDIPGGTPPYEFTFGTNQCGNYSQEGDCYNREHSFPKSWFGGEVSPMYTDLFQVIPTDGWVNSHRGDLPYAKVGTATWTSQNGTKLGPCTTTGYSGTVFEPRDDFKGDMARNYFYMATRYENVIASWENNIATGDAVLDGTSYPAFESWYITLLLQWNEQDPVSQKEIDRNEAVYLIQGNRNPFIDHPEYAAAIWTPNAPAVTTTVASSITPTTATLNGTVNPNGIATSYHFEWGTTVSYGNSTTTVSAGSGTSAVAVNAAITGLTTGATYHFRLSATNSNGTTNGSDMTFTAVVPTLSVTPSGQSVSVTAGSTAYTVTSNSSWTAVSDQSWCTPTASGSGNGTITANYTTNGTGSPRTANITVTVTGLSPVVVSLTQATVAITPEPSNYPASFSACNIRLTWTDATGASVPTGYLVRMSSTGFSNIADPVDGIVIPNGPSDMNIAAGVQEAWFTNLAPLTTYYFKIYGYITVGSDINYITSGEIPSIQKTTGICGN